MAKKKKLYINRVCKNLLQTKNKVCKAVFSSKKKRVKDWIKINYEKTALQIFFTMDDLW